MNSLSEKGMKEGTRHARSFHCSETVNANQKKAARTHGHMSSMLTLRVESLLEHSSIAPGVNGNIMGVEHGC